MKRASIGLAADDSLRGFLNVMLLNSTRTRTTGHWLQRLALPALGVVFGDIGTSPLYTFRQCLLAAGHTPLEPMIFGLLSLIFWTIVFVVSFKYLGYIMRADNQGEGGIMALMALALRSEEAHRHARRLMTLLGLTGAALFYGDAVITPALSVLSAVEGLALIDRDFGPYIVHIALAILIGLFLIQRHGTARVGQLFGPVMLTWFLVIGCVGLIEILKYPWVLKAIHPQYALFFLVDHGFQSLVILGAVVLAVTGAEALYADMGHFGVKPIRVCWFYLVFPALILNYFGQGANVLMHPERFNSPFFLMFPDFLQLPIIILAMLATVIASQAVISGTYSLTQQAFQLGYFPRVRVDQTSDTQKGQIYLPGPNQFMLVATAILVLGFGSSSALASAYGIAVTGTMFTTSLLFYVVARHAWHWHLLKLIPLIGLFVGVDLGFLGANLLKILEGGWLPLLLGGILFIFMSTWMKGKRILAMRLKPMDGHLDDFIKKSISGGVQRVPGTAVYMAAPEEEVPSGLLQNVRHNKVLHQTVIVLSVLVTERARECDARSRHHISVDQKGAGFYRIGAPFGFMEIPDIPAILATCAAEGQLVYDPDDTTYFFSRVFPVSTDLPGMARWRERLFVLMTKNRAFAADFFQIPVDSVVELNKRLDI
jgi:KUP system potassium uptake protein